jgi:hypothetical protein
MFLQGIISRWLVRGSDIYGIGLLHIFPRVERGITGLIPVEFKIQNFDTILKCRSLYERPSGDETP